MAECRIKGCPKSSRSEISASNLILYRLGSPNHHSTTFYNEIQNRLNAEPQGVSEALDRSFRHEIQFSIAWAHQIMILRHSATFYVPCWNLAVQICDHNININRNQHDLIVWWSICLSIGSADGRRIIWIYLCTHKFICLSFFPQGSRICYKLHGLGVWTDVSATTVGP